MRKLPKWAVVAVVAAVFLPLAVDWVAPGEGARLAMEWLDSASRGGRDGTVLFPFWSWLVGLAGKDVAALGAISVVAGMACVWFVAAIFGAIFGAAVRKAESLGVENEFPFVESAAALLAGLSFALTPGLLAAATRISPLMVALAPPLAALALAVRPSKGRLLLAVGLVGYSAFELILARRVFLSLAFPAVWVWLAVGVMPALVIAWCVRKRWLVGRKPLFGALVGWAAVVLVMGATAFTLGTLDRGRVANRIVAQVIANAEEGGKIAIASDGVLDELFFFMLPERVRLISLARERDPAYGRELSDWIIKHRDTETQRTGQPTGLKLAAQPPDPASLCPCASVFKTNIVEDLAFAAELGPRALIDEWAKLDKAGFEAKVATVANYLPTREKWDAACAELEGMRTDEPLAGYLRHLVAVCGNALGCRRIENGKLKMENAEGDREAWAIFRKIVDEVEPTNYGAYLNLLGMVERGYAAPKDEVADLTKRRQQLEKSFQRRDRMFRAARSSGRIYADPEEVEKYEKMQREAAAKRELSPEAQAFVKAVADAPKNPKSGKAAQEAIYKALREGLVGIEGIGGHLITIDLAIGDVENAEKDALSVLKANRHDPTANATLGSLAGIRGDYPRAERYLRRAMATGKASIAAKNDLAYALLQMGRLDEAEPFAREAVKAFDGHWTFHETLAAILINKGRLDEGERELALAEKLARKMGLQERKIDSLRADRALLGKKKAEAK